MVKLAVLASALFVYLVAELFPIGALSSIALGLGVTESRVGLLVSAYAAVAAVTTLPLVRIVKRYDRRALLVASLGLLALAQIAFAVAPNFAIAMAARAVAAIAHGLVWSSIPIVATMFAEANKGGRAVAATFTGTSLALILGVPTLARLADQIGWRASAAWLAAAAAVVAGLLRWALPPLPRRKTADSDGLRPLGKRIDSGPLPRAVYGVCLATCLFVVGNQASYTYIAILVRPAGLGDQSLTWTLIAFGVAGLIGVLTFGRLMDQRPMAAVVLLPVLLAVGVLAIGTTSLWLAITGLVAWGLAAGGLPVVLQTATLSAARSKADRSSAAYVVAFQIGISSGAALGAWLVAAHRGMLMLGSALLFVAGGIALAAAARPTDKSSCLI